MASMDLAKENFGFQFKIRNFFLVCQALDPSAHLKNHQICKTDGQK